MNWPRLPPRLGISWPRPAALRQTVRMTVAAVISSLVADAFGLPQGYWSVLSAIVVMQASVGATVGASLDRLLGTMAGAGVGVFWVLVREHLALPNTLVFALAVAPASLMAALRPSFRIAPMTTVIVLLGAPPGGGLETALNRLAEIALGCVIGGLTAHLVLPDRARGIIDASAAAVLDLLGEVSKAFLHREPDAVIDPLMDAVRRNLRALAIAVDDERWERALLLRTGSMGAPTLRSIRRLRSDVAMIGRALVNDPETDGSSMAPALAAHFAGAAAFLRGAETPPALADLDMAIARVPSGSMLAFAATVLRRDLADLDERLTERPRS